MIFFLFFKSMFYCTYIWNVIFMNISMKFIYDTHNAPDQHDLF